MRSQPKIRASIPNKTIQAIKGINKIVANKKLKKFSPASVSIILLKTQIPKSKKNRNANPDIYKSFLNSSVSCFCPALYLSVGKIVIVPHSSLFLYLIVDIETPFPWW